jgi:hypothetical protein
MTCASVPVISTTARIERNLLQYPLLLLNETAMDTADIVACPRGIFATPLKLVDAFLHPRIECLPYNAQGEPHELEPVLHHCKAGRVLHRDKGLRFVGIVLFLQCGHICSLVGLGEQHQYCGIHLVTGRGEGKVSNT